MQGGTSTRRRSLVARNGVVSGSVWETRIKMDEVKGGIKVFNGNETQTRDDEEGLRVYRRLRRNQSESATEGKKRKSWKSSEISTNPIQLRKARSDVSGSTRVSSANSKEIDEKIEKNVVLKNDNGEEGEIEIEVDIKEIDQEMEREKDEREREEEEEEEDGNCVNENHELPTIDINNNKDEKDEQEEEATLVVQEIDQKEINTETVKETPVIESKGVNPEPLSPTPEKKLSPETEKPSPEKKTVVVTVNKAINPESMSSFPEKKMVTDNRALNPEPVKPSPEKRPALGTDNRGMNPDPVRVSQFKSTPEKRPVNGINLRRTAKPEPRKSIPVEEHEQVRVTPTRNHGRMQNIVDLVMWKDVSKSAFVFGFGTFMLISSSYAKDLNFSLISAISYMGLTYLGLIFIYKTILHRGANTEYDETEEGCILVGEEEAIWILRLVLPYINELLTKLKALFSGDPATTMKLTLLLFAMARCGSFLTLWTLSKLVFFGIFTIPKICSSYSTHLARYGRFWLERVRDGWESCTHKKAVAAALFTLIWNVSSTIARIWAVFILVVAIKYYQQRMVEEWENNGQQEEMELDESKHYVAPKKASPLERERGLSGPGPANKVERERRVKRVI